MWGLIIKEQEIRILVEQLLGTLTDFGKKTPTGSPINMAEMKRLAFTNSILDNMLVTEKQVNLETTQEKGSCLIFKQVFKCK